MLDQSYITFMTVAEEKSFSKAANKLFISPVSVMKQINNLEADLDVQLFIRTHRGVSLTMTGRFLYQKVVALKADADEDLRQIRLMGKKEKIVINLGVSPMRPGTPLFRILRQKKILEDFQLNIVSVDDQDVTIQSPSPKIGHEIDCIVGPCDATDWQHHYRTFVLGQERFKIAVPFGHPLANKPQLSLDDLAGQTLLMPPEESVSVAKLAQYLRDNCPGIELAHTQTYYAPNTFNENTDRLVLTRDSFSNFSSSHVVIDVDWDFTSPYGIIYAKHPSQKMRNFIAAISRATAG